MRISIKAALTGLFALLAVIIAGESALTLLKLSAIRHSAMEVASNWLPSVQKLGELNSAIDKTRVRQYRLVAATRDAQQLAEHRKQYLEMVETVAQKRKQYELLISSPEERALFERLAQDWTQFEAVGKRAVDLMEAGHQVEALAEITQPEVIRRYSHISEIIVQAVALNRQGAQNEAETTVASADSATQVTYVAMAAALGLAVGAMIFSLMRVSRPIARMTATMGTLAAGDTTVAISGSERRDEIGAMAAAVQVFKDNLIRTRQLEDETALARASAEEQRRAGMRQMADSFEQAVGGIVGMVSSSATELQATAQTLTTTAGETAGQSTAVAAAAEEASANVNTVAAAAEELGTSVQEIGRQVFGSADLAQRAVAEADQTATLVQELNGAVSKIGDVVALISSIAGQTNLLALNATIEAARAGEAGRGFAVVASEVKELASQTAKATDEISGQISRIQGATGQAVSAISSITGRIREINAVAATIAAAVEEQGAATQEIVRNVAQASSGTSDVTSNIVGVARSSEDTGAAASQVLASASELSRQSEHLSSEVARFLATVRAA
ncbi:methyl-accepting chemotaxis protein [Methylobacterium sp. R2-1]|uniref:methyl-accepting chemotaxis protein n=1 Tax=Methylobacterium sp. R2-1 TaxID=2587064 RepID=UPI001617FE83|nr:methyl-accepting chemotaxis protein [Methylobacterium sp. R2-1]MBB2964368.1 methyl-accepting chemotaxis protein [Methylobacterium sp. R2-1]